MKINEIMKWKMKIIIIIKWNNNNERKMKNN